MAESRRKFDQDFREGAVRLVRETGKPVAQVARELGVNEGTLGNWVNLDRRRRGAGDGALGEDERAELAAEVARLFAAHRGTYGSPRIAAGLKDLGWKVSENTVAKLMAEQRLEARPRRRRRSLTRQGKGRWR